MEIHLNATPEFKNDPEKMQIITKLCKLAYEMENKRKMKNKIVYETEWIARDNTKEYPNGWGFTAPLVEFPNDADPAWCGEMCRKHLSNEEFECIGAIPRRVISGLFSFDYPKIK